MDDVIKAILMSGEPIEIHRFWRWCPHCKDEEWMRYHPPSDLYTCMECGWHWRPEESADGQQDYSELGKDRL